MSQYHSRRIEHASTEREVTGRFRRLAALAVVVLLGVSLAGCASVDPAPFSQFASSLQPLRAGTAAQAAASVTTARAKLIAEIAAGDVTTDQLQLSISGFGATYGFSDNEPLFAKLARFQHGLAALNDAMVAYAQSLLTLAGGGQGGDILPTAAQFDQMARDLNGNAGSAASALGMKLDPGKQALLSAVAITAFKAYIESKRREELGKAITEVQPQVDEFSTYAKLAVRFLATRVETSYSEQYLALAVADPPNGTAILALNDATTATLATLGALSTNYERLKAAHRDLSAAASKKKTGLAGLTALGDEAIRLNGLVTSMTTANEAAAAAASGS